jgi:pyruvate kinase
VGLIKQRQMKTIWSFKSKVLNEKLAEMVAQSDPDAVRLVYVPGSDDTLVEFLQNLRKQENGAKAIPALLDIAPQPRGKIDNIKEVQDLAFGDTVTFSQNSDKGFKVEGAPCSELFAKGAAVYLGYGNVVLTTLKVEKDTATCEVVQGGSIYPRMNIHVPQTRKSPSLDYLDNIKFSQLSKLGMDYVVLPGLAEPKEIKRIKEKIKKSCDEMPWVILKIDSKDIYENLENLLPLVDGVVISRRELALSMEPASIPMITKEITQLCNHGGKLVLIASEILGSMRHNPTPTRAEVSDIANSVMDGADAVVLSEDIGKGIYSKKALQVCQDAIDDIENNQDIASNWLREVASVNNEFDAVATQANLTANRLGVKAIVCLTKVGNTALKLSSFRQPKPIIAVTFSEGVSRRLSLVRGVSAVKLDVDPTLDEVLPAVNDLLKKRGGFKHGDKYVFVTVTISSLGREDSNLFTVQSIN